MGKKDSSSDERAIHRLFDAWYRAMQDGDVAWLLALVSSDVFIKPPEGEPVAGKRALEAALGAFLESNSETVEFSIEEVGISGSLAFARVSEKATMSSDSDTDLRVVSGMHITILRRQPDGRWLIARDISSLVQTR